MTDICIPAVAWSVRVQRANRSASLCPSAVIAAPENTTITNIQRAAVTVIAATGSVGSLRCDILHEPVRIGEYVDAKAWATNARTRLMGRATTLDGAAALRGTAVERLARIRDNTVIYSEEKRRFAAELISFIREEPS